MGQTRERTIDAFIRWIERCLFHADEYIPPTERDMHVWLKQAKKFKREQDNLVEQAFRHAMSEDLTYPTK